ncbi:MAG TPA: glycosyl hydrolase 108 family protein [Bryobacteraceae bacterium]|jgi:lysozyme family protein|nr:glycosyl hydrolase 108 family protein [Bryobacteraceae bacterium]
MAAFERAVTITLDKEGGFRHNNVTGEVVNHGITLNFVRNSGYHPDADEAFIRNLSVAEATDIYRCYFWNRYSIGSINNQELANKAFDTTVNMGPAALTLLQSAMNALGGQCVTDGMLGPISIAQINSLDARPLLAEFKRLAAERYRQIAADNPDLAEQLADWLARLNS